MTRVSNPGVCVEGARGIGTKRSKRSTATLLSALALAFGLSAPGSYAQTADDAFRFMRRLPGAGSVSIGMAGAGIAGVGDPSALITNPAGLGLVRGSSINGSFSSFNVMDENVFVTPGGEFSGESDVRSNGLGSLASVYKVPTVRGSLVLGIGFHQTSTFERDLYFEGDNDANSITDFFMPLPGEFEFVNDGGELLPDFSRTLSFIAFETYAIDFDQGLYDAGDPVPFLPAVSAGTVAQIGSVIDEGRVNELNFGIAVESARDVMLGLSINIPFSRYTFNRRFEEEDVFDDNDGTGGTTDFAYLDFTEWFQSDMVGINARVGVSVLASPSIRFGAMVETPTFMSIEDEYETVLYTEFDNGDAFEYGDVSSEDAGAGFFEYEILSPWRAGLGLSYRMSGLSLLFDAEWVDWSQLELRSDDFPFTEENRLIRESFEGVVNARLGATYETRGFVIRGGIAYYPDPRDTRYFDDPAGADIDRDRKFVSLGFGFHASDDLMINLGWMQERFDDIYRPYVEVDGAPFVQEEVIRNRFQVGISFAM